MTPKQFRDTMEDIVREEHPDDTLTFEWTRCDRVTWADRSKGFSGNFILRSIQYRTVEFLAILHDGKYVAKKIGR